MTFALNVLLSAAVISFAAWLSARLPVAAGFIVALPLATLLVLPLAYREHGDLEHAITLARSIFVAIPVSLTFFLPFLVADRFALSFWQAYGLGCLALPIGYFVHRAIANAIAA